MKKGHTIISFAFLLTMAAAFTSCASTRTNGNVGEYLDDSVITTSVKSVLAENSFLKSFRIGVGTYQGAVQLSGFVGSKKAFDKAAEIAMSVKGVKSITNNLIVHD
jgi:osmotically-inducible protein OsmY